MDQVSLAPIIAALEAFYPKVIAAYPGAFPHPKEAPVVVISSRGRKKATNSWYVGATWKDADADLLAQLSGPDANGKVQGVPATRAEIVIASEVLGDPVQTGAEFVRQMLAHHRQDVLTTENGYYPHVWNDWAYRVDCYARINPKQPTKGWSQWEPSPTFSKFVQANLDGNPFLVVREPAEAYVRRGSKNKKWRCGCTTVRCAVLLAATCKGCSMPFEWAEEKEGNPYTWVFNRSKTVRGSTTGCEACACERRSRADLSDNDVRCRGNGIGTVNVGCSYYGNWKGGVYDSDKPQYPVVETPAP